MREWKWRTVYQRRQEIWAEWKKRMRRTAEKGSGSHLARVSVRERNGCADRRSYTHTYTHIHTSLHIVLSSPKYSDAHTHFDIWPHRTATYSRPIFNPNSITTTKARCNCNVQLLVRYVWRASPAVFFFFFAVRREFTERDRGQVLVYFQETFKATSELVATYNKCQDRKQRDFSNSELQRVPWSLFDCSCFGFHWCVKAWSHMKDSLIKLIHPTLKKKNKNVTCTLTPSLTFRSFLPRNFSSGL